MMGSLDKKLASIRKFRNMHVVLNKIIKDNREEIIAMNRDQMWEDGIVDVNNPSSILSYAPSTIAQKKKRAKFKRTDHITLKYDGDFHKKMKLKIEPERFIITSTDSKWDKFSSGAWGQGRFENALGLTVANLDKLRNIIKLSLIIRFKNALQSS